MNEYEITATFLNGCAGAAYPQTTFEEVALYNTDDYVRNKHSKDFCRFVKEVHPNGQVVYTFDNGTVTYIYEFNPL